ncbi:hypothetical protein SKAU_G00240280 [Synaphobranchus kaupii]|uniref:Uncharacterized protein n=1 Tax=Synaphobranchus kaupii TaxID=118154 RepID=A0A9Q1F7C0_SYNKA|nr:hypothetical protein SKAU_G00240280 [Synaphobranchus kaupii]
MNTGSVHIPPCQTPASCCRRSDLFQLSGHFILPERWLFKDGRRRRDARHGICLVQPEEADSLSERGQSDRRLEEGRPRGLSPTRRYQSSQIWIRGGSALWETSNGKGPSCDPAPGAPPPPTPSPHPIPPRIPLKTMRPLPEGRGHAQLPISQVSWASGHAAGSQIRPSSRDTRGDELPGASLPTVRRSRPLGVQITWPREGISLPQQVVLKPHPGWDPNEKHKLAWDMYPILTHTL